MKNNFKNWPKEKLSEVSAMGGRATKGISKSFPNRPKGLDSKRRRVSNNILKDLGK